jgi:hypothetical protein
MNCRYLTTRVAPRLSRIRQSVNAARTGTGVELGGSLIHPVIRYVSAHSYLAYGTLFLAAFLEAVPVVGTFIPGSTIILSLSALIATGDLNLLLYFAR